MLAAEQAVADVSAGKKMIDHLGVGTTNDGTKSKLIVKGNIEMLDGDMKYKSDDGQTEYSLKEVSKLAMEGGGTGFDEVKKGVKAITDGTKVFTKIGVGELCDFEKTKRLMKVNRPVDFGITVVVAQQLTD